MTTAGNNPVIETFARLVEEHCPRGQGFDSIGHEDGRLWPALVEGGWLDVGARSAGEERASLTTLALLAVEWGRRLAPLPFSSSVLARRWFDIEPESETRFAMGLADAETITAPFGGADGATLLSDEGSPLELEEAQLDPFAPALPLQRGRGGGALSGEKQGELQLLYAAEALGAAQEASERAAAYAEERIAFGRPVSAFQAIRHWLADMHLDLELASSALLWAASAEGADRRDAVRECARLSRGVAARSIQVFGGIGFTWDLGIHAYLRHAMVAEELARAGTPMPRAGRSSGLRQGESFREEVRAWLETAVPQAWRERPSTLSHEADVAFKREWAKTLYAGGYSGLRWPKAYGGRGLGSLEAAIFYEECARADAPEAVDNSPRSVALTLAGPAIIAHGTEAQKQRYLRPILDGSDTWCEGFSEPGAGSDLAAVSTTAIFDGEVFRINGSKIWTTFAHEADYCYLLARTDPEAPRHKNLSVFLFNMRQPGVRVQPLRNIAGDREFNQVFFDDAIATRDELLGELNGGWQLVTIGAAALRSSGGDGGTSIYWYRYVQLSALLEKLERTGVAADRVGALRARLECLWWTNARAAGVCGEDEGFPPIRGASNIMKIAFSELLQEITTLGQSVASPQMRDFWRREYLLSRSRTIAGGTSQIQRNVIADQILKLRKA